MKPVKFAHGLWYSDVLPIFIIAFYCLIRNGTLIHCTCWNWRYAFELSWGGGQGGQKIHGNAVENVDICEICCVYFCHVWLIHAFPFQFVSIVLWLRSWQALHFTIKSFKGMLKFPLIDLPLRQCWNLILAAGLQCSTTFPSACPPRRSPFIRFEIQLLAVLFSRCEAPKLKKSGKRSVQLEGLRHEEDSNLFSNLCIWIHANMSFWTWDKRKELKRIELATSWQGFANAWITIIETELHLRTHCFCLPCFGR